MWTLFIIEALVGKASIKRRSGGAGVKPLPASIPGLRNGDTPRELNVDDVVDEVGDGLKSIDNNSQVMAMKIVEEIFTSSTCEHCCVCSFDL